MSRPTRIVFYAYDSLWAWLPAVIVYDTNSSFMASSTMSNCYLSFIVATSSTAFADGQFANRAAIPQMSVDWPLKVPSPWSYRHITTKLGNGFSPKRMQILVTLRVERPRISYVSNSTGFTVINDFGSLLTFFFFFLM